MASLFDFDIERVRVQVQFPNPVGLLDYAVPDGLDVCEGDVVRVPLGNRQAVGVVWRRVAESSIAGDGGEDPLDFNKLKPVAEVVDVPPLSAAMRRFVHWVARYTLSSPGAVLRLVLRSPQALQGMRTVQAFALGDGVPERMTPARRKVLDVLADGAVRTASEITEQAGVSAGVVKGLADAGVVQRVERPVDADFPEPDPERAPVTFAGVQQAAVGALVGEVERATYSATLLDGVPGSGKTEVYFEAVAAALRRGEQALILLPEIALTAQFLERFDRRFGCVPASWHSGLSGSERRRVWRKIAEGQAKVVIGARSALFLPFAKLGVIVVDEEHESAYKQEDGVVYHGRDMAVVRASLEDIPVVLVSATPSLETIINVERGKYKRVDLPSRHGAAVMPAIEAVDLRKDPPEAGRWLSPKLVTALAETFARGEQGLLFLNRRGYAPLVLCRKCGHRLQSPNTSTWLVEHRFSNQLVCHHSGFTMPKPKECPKCGTEDSLVGCGPGVERIAEEAQETFPDARIMILSSDTLVTPRSIHDAIETIQKGDVDLLIGTQVIAKGYHFPELTLVGVVDADLGLSGGDLRASERTYQLLFQVAGRAGRGEKPGRVLLQTYAPEHDVIRELINGDRDGFLAAEARARQSFEMPPYGKLASVILSSRDAAQLQDFALRLARAVPDALARAGGAVFGPTPAPLALVRGRHRMRFLVKAKRDFDVQNYLRKWLRGHKPPAGVRLSVDIDPYSFL